LNISSKKSNITPVSNPFFSSASERETPISPIKKLVSSTPLKHEQESSTTTSKGNTLKPTISTIKENTAKQLTVSKPLPNNSVEVKKKTTKENKPLNSLQKLCESYGDTDSSAPSSPSQTVLPSALLELGSEPLQQQQKANSKENNSSLASPVDRSSLLKPLPLTTTNSIIKEPANNKSSKKLKSHHLNRNCIWSPVTKGVLHPRVIINRSWSDIEAKSSDMEENRNTTINTETGTPFYKYGTWISVKKKHTKKLGASNLKTKTSLERGKKLKFNFF